MNKDKKKSKGISSHLADIFFQIEMLKENNSEFNTRTIKIERGVHALAKELYRLKQIIITDRKNCHACGEELTVGEIECNECDFSALHRRTNKV